MLETLAQDHEIKTNFERCTTLSGIVLILAIACFWFILNDTVLNEGIEKGQHHRSTKKIFNPKMAWRCSGSTNQEVVQKLKDAGIIGTDRAEAAMLNVDRGNYCDEQNPYLDRPGQIGYNVTISAPHMHAYALTILTDQLREGAKALDVGSGSGYLTACMAHMVGPRGKVIGVEHIPELVEASTKNIRKQHPEYLDENRIKFVVTDGRQGYPEEGPYDAIHVGAAATTLPQELIDQLAPGGRLICPVVAFEEFNRYQDLLQVDKKEDGTVTKTKLMQVSYVLLTDAESQLKI